MLLKWAMQVMLFAWTGVPYNIKQRYEKKYLNVKDLLDENKQQVTIVKHSYLFKKKKKKLPPIFYIYIIDL